MITMYLSVAVVILLLQEMVGRSKGLWIAGVVLPSLFLILGCILRLEISDSDEQNESH